ncbi:MAG: hypothetical protein NZ551_09560 [Microscillaceae bacterium]|nr:hypothetical protein [Microscillaceae bacterium]MDW8461447.1 hypothetical protein [Cytophagales bacterium]
MRSGRRASGYPNASVRSCASHRANARPPHASRKKALQSLAGLFYLFTLQQTSLLYSLFALG